MDTKALRQKILDLAIRGKLVPQDPNDEPASVLLERIRAEKQQMVKDGKLKPKDIKNDTIIFVGEDNLHYEQFTDGTVKCIEDEIPFDVPEGWAWVRLATVLSLSSGKSIKVRQLTDEGEFSVYGGNGINGTYSDYNVDSDTIIIGRVGFYCGNVYKTSSKAWVTDNALIAAIKEKGIFDIDFLVAVLKYLDLGKTSVSTAQPVVSGKGILPLIVPVPPKIEQNRILKSYIQIMPVLDLIENNKEEVLSLISMTKSKILDLAIRGQLVPQDPNDEPASLLLERIRAEKEELIKAGKIKRDKKESTIFKGEDNSYYESIKGKCICIDNDLPLNIPESWMWSKIDNIAFVTKLAGFEYTKNIAPNLCEKGIPLFKGKNVQDSTIIYEFEAFIPEEISDELSRSQITRKCILTPYVGTIGNIAIHNKPGKYHLGSNVGKIELYNKNTLLFEEYVVAYLQSSFGYQQLTKHMKATAQPSISIEAIRDVYIPIPPENEQQKIVLLLNTVVSKIDLIKNVLI